MLAYQQMTQEERDKYNALVAWLDDKLHERKSRERRLQSVPVEQDRRVADRRKFQR